MNKDKIVSMGKEILSIEPIRNMLDQNKCSFSFVAGSLVEGFGNEKSDVDVFIICQSLPVNQEVQKFFDIYPDSNVFYNNKNVVLTFTYENMDFDVEFHLVSEVEKAIKRNNLKEIKSSDAYVDFLHRLKWSFFLNGEENYKAIKESVNYDCFSDIPVRYLSMIYSIKTTDIMGAYREKDFKTAFFMSWFLLEYCIDAYLSLFGETNPNNKWRVKKIDRLEMQSEYRGINLSGIMENTFSNLELDNDLMLEKRTREVMRNCQIINNSIQKGRI
ncbi:hypothetical protein G6H54_002184 [Listeria monocytogenes]|nr:hypothetical protein [Listeria monocytogenes]EEO7553716.1 hypothetical protein [Listeria monocytogenes]EEO9089452.1 hypothetical protein [Listeria monocytogenes]